MAEERKGLFAKMRGMRERAAKNSMPSVEVGEDMSRAGRPGGGLTDAQAEAMSEGKPLPKRTPPKKPEIDPGIRSLKEMTDREIRGEPPINRITKSTSDVVTVPNAFTDTAGKTYYQPKGDPFQYEYDATDKSFTAKKDGQDVVTVRPGDPAYEEFLKHAKGGATSAHGGKAAAAKPAAAKASDVDEFGYPIDSATPPEQMETSAVEVSEPPMSPDDPNQLPPMSPDAPKTPAAGGPDESVFAPPGARSEMPMADQVPGETIRAEDPGMRTMRAQEAGRTEEDVTEAQRASLQATAYSETLTDEQKAERLNAEGVFYSPANSLEIFDAIYKGPQPIVRDGVLNNNNVLNAIATGKLSPEDWPLIKRQLERFGDFKTEVGADPTKDPRLLAKIAARRAMSDQ
jgi:hypothetical protein